MTEDSSYTQKSNVRIMSVKKQIKKKKVMVQKEGPKWVIYSCLRSRLKVQCQGLSPRLWLLWRWDYSRSRVLEAGSVLWEPQAPEKVSEKSGFKCGRPWSILWFIFSYFIHAWYMILKILLAECTIINDRKLLSEFNSCYFPPQWYAV